MEKSKKLTDTEIKKALEESISFDEPYESDFTLIRIEYIKNALDLINRYEEEIEKLIKLNNLESEMVVEKSKEIERLTTLAELGNMRANDYRVMRDRALKAEAEIERLNTYLDVISCSTDKIKAEAYKEFAEQLDAEIESSDKYIREYDDSEVQKAYNKGLRDALKVLKELVGE